MYSHTSSRAHGRSRAERTGGSQRAPTVAAAHVHEEEEPQPENDAVWNEDVNEGNDGYGAAAW